MKQLNVKQYYSAAEIAVLELSSVPSATKNILAKAKRENWSHRPRMGRGGGIEFEFSS
ncbi:DNA-binding protein, partial [Avibacterium paragallinarum]